MIALARLMLIVFVVLTVIYVSLSLYSRSVRRDKLEAEWDAGGVDVPRDHFIRQGLEDYDQSLRHKLILGVYIVPVVIICVIIYFVNFA